MDGMAPQQNVEIAAGPLHGMRDPDDRVVLLLERCAVRGFDDLQYLHGGLLLGGDHERVVRGFRHLPEVGRRAAPDARSEEHTSELQSLMRISYAVFCLNKKNSYNRILRTTKKLKS